MSFHELDFFFGHAFVLAANHMFYMPRLCALRVICRLVALIAELS